MSYSEEARGVLHSLAETASPQRPAQPSALSSCDAEKRSIYNIEDRKSHKGTLQTIHELNPSEDLLRVASAVPVLRRLLPSTGRTQAPRRSVN